MTKLPIAEINALSSAEFIARFDDIAEHSPWVAEAAEKARPFASRDAFVEAFVAAMDAAGHDFQLALIRAHPDLAGRAAMRGDLTADSMSEQAGAGLDSLTREEFERFTYLNDRYKTRFGFPFIFAVKGATKTMILAAFEDRIRNAPETEFVTALTQVGRIFRFRIEDRVDA